MNKSDKKTTHIFQHFMTVISYYIVCEIVIKKNEKQILYSIEGFISETIEASFKKNSSS